MSISPVSPVNAPQGPQPVQNQNVSKHKQHHSAQPPTDTVHLSPEAQAHLKSTGDVDHDGDSH